jgi:1,4-alpha-glucan branching enzyme
VLLPILRPVTFRFSSTLAPAARNVAVVGPFNGWNPTVHPLVRTTAGHWMITVFLPPGRLVYCFVVDGVSRPDPNVQARLLSGEGLEYSVSDIL